MYPMTDTTLPVQPIPVTDVASAVGTLGIYVVALSAVVFAALTFRYGFAAVWNALKSALRIGTKATKTGS